MLSLALDDQIWVNRLHSFINISAPTQPATLNHIAPPSYSTNISHVHSSQYDTENDIYTLLDSVSDILSTVQGVSAYPKVSPEALEIYDMLQSFAT
jgi:hypothetical protein